MSGSGRKAFRMSETGRKAISNVREWSGGPPGFPGAVGGPHGCPRVVEWPSRMSGSD